MLTRILEPKTIDDIVGQNHLLDHNKVFYKIIKSGKIPNLFLYGPPGCGKTTIAKIIANETKRDFYSLNATNFKIDEFRLIAKRYTGGLSETIIFIDETHSLSKNQQEALLPYLEYDSIRIIGASTENPFFSFIPALRSRSFVFEMHEIDDASMEIVVDKAMAKLEATIEKKAKQELIDFVCGDIRAACNVLEVACSISKEITAVTVSEILHVRYRDSGKNKGNQYDLMSALIKSIRGSDIDASLYYLACLLLESHNVFYIARRLVVLASEDISNANPNALNLAVNTMQAVQSIGMPEARIILAQCVIYLASSPKSNSSYLAINSALQYAQEEQQNIPNILKPTSKGYKYPHDFGGFVKQQYASLKKSFYNTKQIGFEKTLYEWHHKITKDS